MEYEIWASTHKIQISSFHIVLHTKHCFAPQCFVNVHNLVQVSQT